MFEKISKKAATEFINIQESAGDLTALHALKTEIFNSDADFLSETLEIKAWLRNRELYFLNSMIELNSLVIAMEQGDINWDAEVNDYYRDGIALLLNKCKKILK